jgi:hypothetical protein
LKGHGFSRRGNGDCKREIPSGAKAHRSLSAACGTTEQAAEKPLLHGETRENPSAGAEAHRLLPVTYGTTEVVP